MKHHPPPVVWDLVIVLLLLVNVAIAVWINVWLGLFGFAVIAYGSFIEPRLLRVRRVKIPFPLQKPLRIVVASDMHIGPYKREAFLERLCDRILALTPDLILLPGDFLYNEKADVRPLHPLKKLHAPLGVFAVLGNHDMGHYITFRHEHFSTVDRSAELTPMLTSLGIRVLRNEHVILKHGDTQFALAGIDDLWDEKVDIAAAFRDIPAGMPTLLLSHFPDVILHEEHTRAALIVSGHTHGGQVRLPLLGPVMPIPNDLGNTYDRGLFMLDTNRYLFITQGVGECLPRARLCCPPEIVLIETTL